MRVGEDDNPYNQVIKENMLFYTQGETGQSLKDSMSRLITGSDILWVSCSPCTGCPSTSGLNYGDGELSGYYLSDTLFFDMVSGDGQISTLLQPLFLGSDNGGVILVLGEIVEPWLLWVCRRNNGFGFSVQNVSTSSGKNEYLNA
ncbi:hypothetical protein HPP92_026630, partial [Vanilla planifolia]